MSQRLDEQQIQCQLSQVPQAQVRYRRRPESALRCVHWTQPVHLTEVIRGVLMFGGET